MEPEMQNSNVKNKKKSVVLVVLAVFIFLMLSATTALAFMLLQNDEVYKGICIADQNVSGMSKHDMELLLDAKYQKALDALDVTLETEKDQLKSSYPELGIQYDTKAAADNAYSIGRVGGVFKRLNDIVHAGIKGIELDIPLIYDEDKLENLVNNFYDMTFMNVKEGSLLITDTDVIIRSGSHGESIDKPKTLALVKALINEHKSGIIEPEIIVTPPKAFNIDDLYQQIVSEPTNASYEMENLELKLIPHTVGREIGKDLLSDIVAKLGKTENTELILPVTFTNPEITSDIAASMLFRDELATFTTYFSTATENGQNRKFNMTLAVDKINNMILSPGQEFSFNEVVGPRDVEHGYKTAHIYSNGKIIDGIGGGICQVSTTLYNSVLKADLQVKARRGHSFTVGYAPLGQDATAYYGGTDFKFLNSTKMPIRLHALVSGNKISTSITGTSDIANKTVIISNKVLQKTPFTIQYIDDPTLPVGTTKEQQQGLDGYIVESYKTIKIDSKIVSQAKLYTSKYNPCTQIILVGTKTDDTVTAPVSGNVPDNTPEPVDNNDPVESPDPNDSSAPIDEASPPIDVLPDDDNASNNSKEPSE